MADDARFYEGGVKMLVSLGSFALGPVPGIIGAIAFVKGVLDFMTQSATIDAVAKLQERVDEVVVGLNQLTQRVDALTNDVARSDNKAAMDQLQDRHERIRLAAIRLRDRPLDVDNAVDVANEMGLLIDAFLRDDLELWRWTDIVERDGLPALAKDRFKSRPTLGVYELGLLTWLAARELPVHSEQRDRLVDDEARVTRHLRAVSVRPEFDKYADGPAGTPESIAEHVVWRIRGWLQVSHQQPQDRQCDYFFETRDWMSGRKQTGDGFARLVASNSVFCTIDPASVGAPATELDWEQDAGLAELEVLATTLARVERTGTVREQLIGVFPTGEVFAPALLFVVDGPGDLQWYRNDNAGRPGGSTSWAGPREIGTDFRGFTHFFHGGGVATYGVRADGELWWRSFAGHSDGEPTWGPEWVVVGQGWDSFEHVFPGGGGILYGVDGDGSLLWFRHLRSQSGTGGAGADVWDGPRRVGIGWDGLTKVFSGGEGTVYSLDAGGNLRRGLHTGFRTGDDVWHPDGLPTIGIGWNTFVDVVASGGGVLHGVKRDGTVHVARYGPPRADAAGIPDWDGPAIEVRSGLAAFRSWSAWLEPPFVVGGGVN